MAVVFLPWFLLALTVVAAFLLVSILALVPPLKLSAFLMN